MKSYSQLGEDVYCFQNFMNTPRQDVVLVEVGAYDGLAYSNTFALEQFHDCKCILIEPSPVGNYPVDVADLDCCNECDGLSNRERDYFGDD